MCLHHWGPRGPCPSLSSKQLPVARFPSLSSVLVPQPSSCPSARLLSLSPVPIPQPGSHPSARLPSLGPVPGPQPTAETSRVPQSCGVALTIARFIERERASPGPCLWTRGKYRPAEGGLSSLQVPDNGVLDGWTDGQRNEWLLRWKDGLRRGELCGSRKPTVHGNSTLTREDEEDAGDKGQDGPVRTDVSDVAQDKPNEHEEETDQRERCGRANHF